VKAAFVLVVPLLVGADERPVCRIDPAERDRYGCVGFRYVQERMADCRPPREFCFSLQYREWPSRNSLVVNGSGRNPERVRAKAEAVCQQMMAASPYEACVVGRVEVREGPTELVVEVVQGEK